MYPAIRIPCALPQTNLIIFAMAAINLNAEPHSLASLLQQFFADYLPTQRNLSRHTIRAYRDTFRLFLKFLFQNRQVAIDLVSFDDLAPEVVLSFLDHLENERHNSVRSRNARLAAFRSFARFAVGQIGPERLVACQRLLTLPIKRWIRPTLGFMNRSEMAAVLDAISPQTWSGRRDRLFFSLLYNTGARVSEMLQLRAVDHQGRAVLLHGKGRKERTVPLWNGTARQLRQWIQSNRIASDQPVFTNYRREPLSREGVAFRLKTAVQTASARCPSLCTKHVTPHTFRHTSAMHLLQSRVPLEVIALWLGHERPTTTHGYVQADLLLKQQCLDRLARPMQRRRQSSKLDNSRLLAFLEAI